jgi:CBS domain containing-hemolysin-like protein
MSSFRKIKQLFKAKPKGEEKVFTPEQRDMVQNIVALKDKKVEDLYIPRGDIVAVETTILLSELIENFEEAGHTRLIVYEESLDDPVGLVHIKDLLAYILAQARALRGSEETPIDLGKVNLNSELKAAKLIRPVLYVPPSMPAVSLLEKMQATRIHMALVVDEYGGTDGLVSLKDIVENIIGDMDDEHDEGDKYIQNPSKDIYIADARAPLEDVRELLGESFRIDDEISEEVSTLGGYLTFIAGYLPVRGEVILASGYEFQVLDADPRRVKRVRIVKPREDLPKLRDPRKKKKDEEG